MWWILAVVCFAIAAIMALLITGVSLTVIVGIIAIGLFFLAFDSGGWTPRMPPPRR